MRTFHISVFAGALVVAACGENVNDGAAPSATLATAAATANAATADLDAAETTPTTTADATPTAPPEPEPPTTVRPATLPPTTLPPTTASATTIPNTPPPPPPPPTFDLARPAPCGMSSPVSVGDVGADVACLERRLADTAANVAPFVVDDVYGPDTDQVVRQFQAAYGLAVDGAVGPQTASALGIWSPPPPPPPQPATPSACTPGYDPCLPPASDYDCTGGSGNGPAYTGRVRVTGSDPYDLDRDGDGVGCD